MKEVNIGKQGFLFGTLNKSKFKMNVKSFMNFCSKYNLTGQKVKYNVTGFVTNQQGLKIADIVRLFKLESSKKGSHIHFREFEILLFKMAKILYTTSSCGTDEKYFKLVQKILKPDQSSLIHQHKFKQSKKKQKRRGQNSTIESNRPLPEIVFKTLLELTIGDQKKSKTSEIQQKSQL